MIIRNLNVSNKYIKYNNISLNFNKPGIYKISGENGTGKTTILEEIVFGDYNVEFPNDSFFEEWKNNRVCLFTYIPQKIYEYTLTVYEYICKGNSQISLKECNKLLSNFGLTNEILKTQFNVLSGGEKKKIQIVSGLLKNTPYIFMDEPSNNLDNSSVDNLNKILKKISKNKVIIIVSHDDRILVDVNCDYILDGTTVQKSENKTNSLNLNIDNCTKIKKDYIFTILKIIKNLPQIATIIFLIFIITFMVFYSYDDFSNTFYKTEYFNQETILIRSITEYNSDINDYYIKSEKIDIDKTIQNKNVKWEDILNDISKLNYVNDIYIKNTIFYDDLSLKIYNNSLLDNKFFISCPKEYYSILYDYVLTVGAINIVEGNIPQDFKKEVSLSKNVLIKYYGYNETNVNDALGDKIYIEEFNSEYTIVGFTYFDYINISFEKNLNNLIYTFSEDTYESFAHDQILYLYEDDGWFDRVSEIVLVINAENNKEATDYLLSKYPCIEIVSSSFDEITVKQNNYQRFITFLFINIGISAVFAIAFFFLNSYSFRYNLNIIEDFGIYYINKKSIMLVYKLVVLLIMLIVIMILLGINTLIDKYAYYTNIYIFIDSFITLLPLSLYLIMNRGTKKK